MAEPWMPGPWVAEDRGPNIKVFFAGQDARGNRRSPCFLADGDQEANARLIAQSPRFADIAARAQYLANERGGDYSALSKDELCAFMVEFDGALSDARGES